MSEKDPFEKYDKLFDEQDEKYGQKKSKADYSPSFDNIEEDQFKPNQSKQKESNQMIGIVVSIVVGIIVLRNMVFSSSPTFFGSMISVLIIIGITSSIYKYFKNKR